MSDILVLEFESHKLLTQNIDGQAWFRFEDIFEALDFGATTHTFSKINNSFIPSQLAAVAWGQVPEEYKKETTETNPITGEKQVSRYLSEKGIYRLAQRSYSPKSERFQDWLADVCLAIRKYGCYPPPPPTPQGTQDSELKSLARTLIQISETIFKEIEEREKLENLVIEKFGITDQRLKTLTDRLDKFEHTQPEDFADVNIICADRNENIDITLVFNWCYKICLEKNIPTKKDHKSSLGRLFPLNVVNEAIAITKDTI